MLMVLKLTITIAPSTIGSTSLTWIDCCIALIIASPFLVPLCHRARGAVCPEPSNRCRCERLGYPATLVGIGRQFEGADGLAQCVGQGRQVVNRHRCLFGACSRLLRDLGDLTHG